MRKIFELKQASIKAFLKAFKNFKLPRCQQTVLF